MHAIVYNYLGFLGSSSQVLSPDSIGVTLQDSLSVYNSNDISSIPEVHLTSID